MNEPLTLPLILLAGLIVSLLVGSAMAWLLVVFRPLTGLPPLLPQEGVTAPRIPPVTAVVGWGITGLLLLMMGLDFLLSLNQPPKDFDAKSTLQLVQYTLLQNGAISAILMLTIFAGRASLRDLGFYGRGWLRPCLDAGLGLLLSIGPVFFLLFATFIAGLRTEDTAHDFLKLVEDLNSVQTWIWVTVAAVIAAPLFEELLFRVVLQTSIERFFIVTGSLLQVSVPSWTPAVAIAISSIVFCAVHRFPDSVALMPLALVLGYVYYRRRSYWTIVLIHALFNGINLFITALGNGAPK